jgi:hypothetical protein
LFRGISQARVPRGPVAGPRGIRCVLFRSPGCSDSLLRFSPCRPVPAARAGCWPVLANWYLNNPRCGRGRARGAVCTGIPSFRNGLKEEPGAQAGRFSQIPVRIPPRTCPGTRSVRYRARSRCLRRRCLDVVIGVVRLRRHVPPGSCRQCRRHHCQRCPRSNCRCRTRRWRRNCS